MKMFLCPHSPFLQLSRAGESLEKHTYHHSLLFRLFPRLSVSGKQKRWISEDEPPPSELSDLHEEANFDFVRRSSQRRRIMTE